MKTSPFELFSPKRQNDPFKSSQIISVLSQHLIVGSHLHSELNVKIFRDVCESLYHLPTLQPCSLLSHELDRHVPRQGRCSSDSLRLEHFFPQESAAWLNPSPLLRLTSHLLGEVALATALFNTEHSPRPPRGFPQILMSLYFFLLPLDLPLPNILNNFLSPAII